MNLVKIDGQGFEGHALRGMARTLANSPDLIVLMEFWPHGQRSAGFEPKEIFIFCERLGLRVFTPTKNGKVQLRKDPDALIRAYPGRKYANLVAAKGADSLEKLGVR